MLGAMSDPFLGWNVLSAGLRPEPFLILLAALALDAVGGNRLRRYAWHPQRVLEATVAFLEPRLNRPQRGAVNRLLRGALLVAVLALLGAAVAWLVTVLGARVPFGWIAVLAATMTLIDQRRPFDEARRRLIHLDGGGTGDPGAAAAALATGLAGGVIAASFWFALLGLPGLAAFRAIALTAALVDERRQAIGVFGLTPSRLNEALLYLPAMLSELALAVAALFVPGARPGRVFGAMARGATRYHNLAHGFVIAAIAASFGPTPGPGDVRRALYLYLVACLLNLAAIALLAMAGLTV